MSRYLKTPRLLLTIKLLIIFFKVFNLAGQCLSVGFATDCLLYIVAVLTCSKFLQCFGSILFGVEIDLGAYI